VCPVSPSVRRICDHAGTTCVTNRTPISNRVPRTAEPFQVIGYRFERLENNEVAESTWSPPAAESGPPVNTPSRKPKRPKFGFIIVFGLLFRGGREVLDRVAFAKFGFVGFIVVAAAGLAIVLGWRALAARKRAQNGGAELSQDGIRKQVDDSGVGEPAFAGDGSILGSSILVVNQRTKLVEINTAYDIHDHAGRPLGTIEQFGQSRARRAVRVFTAFDQFLTHHFEVTDLAGFPVLRITRPRKWLKTKVHIFGPGDQFLGSILQQNVFGRIRFHLVDAAGNRHGELKAEQLRAWDFQLLDASGLSTASVIKSWEGWARTAFTKSDRYVVRVHRELPSPVRELTVACALSIDLALKQDARSFG
jgi:uncharacterized protein YxjI